jgi:hypothetical protein
MKRIHLENGVAIPDHIQLSKAKDKVEWVAFGQTHYVEFGTDNPFNKDATYAVHPGEPVVTEIHPKAGLGKHFYGVRQAGAVAADPDVEIVP